MIARAVMVEVALDVRRATSASAAAGRVPPWIAVAAVMPPADAGRGRAQRAGAELVEVAPRMA